MNVVDASVWVSSLVVLDANHLVSNRWLQAQLAAGVSLFAPMHCLAEVSGAVTRRSGRPTVGHRVLRDLLNLDQLELVAMDLAVGQASALAAIELGLRGADAVYVALAHQLGVRLVTWDQEQLARGAALVETATPADDPVAG